MSDGIFFSNEDDALNHAWDDPASDEGDASATAPETGLPPEIVESAIERCEQYLLVRHQFLWVICVIFRAQLRFDERGRPSRLRLRSPLQV